MNPRVEEWIENQKPKEDFSYVLIHEDIPYMDISKGKHKIVSETSNSYVLEEGQKLKFSFCGKNDIKVHIAKNLKKQDPRLKRLEWKKNSRIISTIMPRLWREEIGKSLFSKTVARFQGERTPLVEKQIEKLKKRDLNDTNIRQKKEKRVKDREYEKFLIEEAKRAKTITKGHDLFDNINTRFLLHAEIPEFADKEIKHFHTIKVYELLLKSLETSVGQLVNADEFYLEAKSMDNPNVAELATKLFYLLINKKKKNIDHIAIKNLQRIITFMTSDSLELEIKNTTASRPIKSSKSSASENYGLSESPPNDKMSDKEKKIKKEAGLKHENSIDRVIRSKIPRSLYLTEEDMAERNTDAMRNYKAKPFARTPDYYFHKDPIMLNNVPICWIDCKKCTIVPGLTSDSEHKEYKDQIDSYCKLYGPGMVIFHRSHLSNISDLYQRPDMVFHRVFSEEPTETNTL